MYFILVVRNLVLKKTKKSDGLDEAKTKFRQLIQKAASKSELNVLADYPGLLDEALSKMPFCYQLFYPDGKRSSDELGCVIENLEGDIKDLVSKNEERLKEEFKRTKIRYLKEMKYEQLLPEEQQKLVNEVDKVNRQRTQTRRRYYAIGAKSDLDNDFLIVDNYVQFSGMQLNLMRVGYEQTEGQTVILAVTNEANVSTFIENLTRLIEEYYIIILIKDVWQFNVRKLT